MGYRKTVRVTYNHPGGNPYYKLAKHASTLQLGDDKMLHYNVIFAPLALLDVRLANAESHGSCHTSVSVKPNPAKFAPPVCGLGPRMPPWTVHLHVVVSYLVQRPTANLRGSGNLYPAC